MVIYTDIGSTLITYFTYLMLKRELKKKIALTANLSWLNIFRRQNQTNDCFQGCTNDVKHKIIHKTGSFPLDKKLVLKLHMFCHGNY